jgi:hypothetical protein
MIQIFTNSDDGTGTVRKVLFGCSDLESVKQYYGHYLGNQKDATPVLFHWFRILTFLQLSKDIYNDKFPPLFRQMQAQGSLNTFLMISN